VIKLTYSSPQIIRLLLAIFLLAYINANAQDERSSWQLGITFSLENSFRKLKSNDSAFNINMLPYREKTEVPATGFSTGFNLKYQVYSGWFLRSGLHYEERTYAQKKCSICWPGPPPDCDLITVV
jgi:hypothetical protein